MNIWIELYLTWARIGLFTFGGGYAMLPMIQKEVIEKHHWATEDEIMDYYAIAQCTPGVIAVNTSTFVGYKLRGVMGGIVSTLGVITPSLIIITIIAAAISNFSDLPIVRHALAGIQIAVCVLMMKAIYNMFKKSIVDIPTFLIFLTAFVLAYFTNISTVILVILTGAAGYVLYLLKDRKGGVGK